MNKKIIICIFSIILVILIIAGVILVNKNSDTGSGKKPLPVDYENENKEENIVEEKETQEKITNMIENQGFSANENMYELAEEYDGRQTLIVKSSIQYKVALSGMLKKEKPEFQEIDELLKKAPSHTGIFIEENSRKEFLDILKDIVNGSYDIDEDGFLVKKQVLIPNDYDKIILDMISNGSLYVFDINSVTYLVDQVTGEITEYPFEEMDPYQEYEYFESDNKYMFIISKNNQEKISKKEALKNILENK